MARLIDGEKLLDAVQGAINIMESHGISMIAASVPLAIIKGAPTIDAIPMWWITEKFLDVLNKDKELSKAVWLVREAWQKEQGDCDTKCDSVTHWMPLPEPPKEEK